MKRLQILLFILFLISCTKEKQKPNIDENIQVYYYYYSNYSAYYGDNSLKFKIQLAPLDSNYKGIDDFDKYFKYIEAGQIKNGKLTLTLENNTIDEKYCKNIIDVLRIPRINISNNEAKIFKIGPSIDVFNYENKAIGFLRLEGYDCSMSKFGLLHLDSSCSTVFFIYATEETKITREDDDSLIYNFDLKKGWNKIYCYENDIFPQWIYTTNSENFPVGVNWQIIFY
jgi:hypothetical protein